MRGLYRGACLLLVASAATLGAAPPDVPKELKVDAGQLVRIVAKGDKIGTARNFPDDAAFFDELAPQMGVRRYVFQATKPGTYVIAFWTTGEDYGTTCTITVGTPVPPVPPTPPVPPAPVDQFTRDLATAFGNETAVTRARDVAALASLYRSAATITVNDPTVKTYADLFGDMKAASVTLLDPAAIPAVRKVIGGRLNPLMSDPAKLIDRAQTAAEFKAIATALETLR